MDKKVDEFVLMSTAIIPGLSTELYTTNEKVGCGIGILFQISRGIPI